MIEEILKTEPLATHLKLSSIFQVPDQPIKGFHWIDKDGNWTDNVNEVISKEKVEIAVSREAKTPDDFNVVLNRQMEIANLETTTEQKNYFAPKLIKYLNDTISQFEKNVPLESQVGCHSLIFTAHNFTKWLEGECKKNFNENVSTGQNDKGYSLKEIAIAYFLMSIYLDEEKAKKALKDHSHFTSYDRLLSKRITRAGDLSKTRDDRSANTKHLKSLQSVERLVTGKNHQQAMNSIKVIISAFKANMEKLN